MSNRKLSAKQGARLVAACEDQLRAIAGVGPADQQKNAAHFVFNRMLTALAESVKGRGSARITKTYVQWAMVASERGSFKRTTGGSLRNPFSVWKSAIEEAGAIVPELGATADRTVSDGVENPPSATTVDLRAVRCKFEIVTPGPGGRGKPGGEAGLTVEFIDHDDGLLAVRPPVRMTDALPIEQELEKIAGAKERERELEKSRRPYLLDLERWFGPKAAAKVEKRLDKEEKAARIQWMRPAAAVILCVIVLGIATQRAAAAYREERERLRRVFTGYSIAAVGGCNDKGEPLVRVSFSDRELGPPFAIFRDDQQVGTIERSEPGGGYGFSDTNVLEGHSYVYRVGKKVWGVGGFVTSPSLTPAVPRCRHAGNQPPVVGEVQTTSDILRPGESFEAWVEAYDPDGDTLEYTWVLPDGTMPHGPGPRIRTKIEEPGRHDLTVIVSDGQEPRVVVSRWVGVSAMNPHNHPPLLPTLLAAPQVIRPGQTVRFDAPASDADGDPLQYEWDFDEDKSIGGRSSRAVDMLYDKPGIYHPSVTVIDSSLATVEGRTTVEVRADAPPQRVRCTEIQELPTYNPAVSAEETLVALFNSELRAPLHVTWDFGDGSPLAFTTDNATKHRYRKQGVYTASAMVVVGDGRDICAPARVVVGTHTPQPPAQDLPLWGHATPGRGTTATLFRLYASPPSDASDNEFRWALLNTTTHQLIETKEWRSETTYDYRFPEEGLWEVYYIARDRNHSNPERRDIGFVPISNKPPSNAAPQGELPRGTPTAPAPHPP